MSYYIITIVLVIVQTRPSTLFEWPPESEPERSLILAAQAAGIG